MGNSTTNHTFIGPSINHMGMKDTIDTQKIYDAHTKIKEIVLEYKNIQKEVSSITADVEDNWVGEGRNEFEAQYYLLVSKIKDFGDTLQEIYDALVDAEAAYETCDDEIRQDFVMAKNS